MSITRIRGGLQVKDGSVLSSDIANGAITSEKLSVSVLGAHSASSLETATGTVVVALSADPVAGQVLVATSPTNATWQTFSVSGTITGSGTTGSVALWTGSSAVGDSLLSQSGGVVTLAGQLKVTGGTPAAGYVLTSDAAGLATWEAPPSSGSTFVDLVQVSGVVDGINKIFVLPSTPFVGSLHLFVNGLLYRGGIGNDYELATNTVTFDTAPLTGSVVLASYRL